MSRASSAGIYGPSWIDPSRTPARRVRRAYGLRTASNPDGWVPAYGSRPVSVRNRPRPVTDPVTNLVGPVDDDDAPLMVRPRIDYAGERRLVPPIRMADF